MIQKKEVLHVEWEMELLWEEKNKKWKTAKHKEKEEVEKYDDDDNEEEDIKCKKDAKKPDHGREQKK